MKQAQRFWDTIAVLFNEILHHPFNRELSQGTLSEEKFLFYLQQDALYLLDYGKALSLIAARSETPRRMCDFIRFASGIFTVEESMHGTFFAEYSIQAPSRVKSPACFAYTNFLLATASLRSYEEAIAAVLPCFWVYRELGLAIHARSVSGNPYQKWIDTYAGDEFGEATETAIEALEETITSATPTTQRRMEEAFVYSTRLEWLFWDSAYTMEPWKP
ncbi:MAG TPA: TenA family protein [Spirochaetales bacterium]|nr:TenA family protein [Spirochaetales bacterium]